MWIVFIAAASIAATAVLTWVLWRINLAMLRDPNPGPSVPDDEDD
jgi:hypothetical protein